MMSPSSSASTKSTISNNGAQKPKPETAAALPLPHDLLLSPKALELSLSPPRAPPFGSLQRTLLLTGGGPSADSFESNTNQPTSSLSRAAAAPLESWQQCERHGKPAGRRRGPQSDPARNAATATAGSVSASLAPQQTATTATTPIWPNSRPTPLRAKSACGGPCRNKTSFATTGTFAWSRTGW